MTYRLASLARCDLQELSKYIGKRNPAAAEKILDEIVNRFELIGSQPAIGAPRDDLLESLDGEVQVRIGSGQLAEVKPGAGRVFGLMSIAALPRRLALDFRDVFGKGFAVRLLSMATATCSFREQPIRSISRGQTILITVAETPSSRSRAHQESCSG